MTNKIDVDIETSEALFEAIRILNKNKPGDRSERDRYYAVTKTLLEQAIALFCYNVDAKCP